MMTTGGIIMIIGTILSVTAFGPGARGVNGNVGGFAQFIISRIITGVGNGMNTATIPSWVAESSKAHNRGFLICIEASTVAVGTVIAYWIVFGLSYIDVSLAVSPLESR
jgi:MFS family permease